MAMVVGAPAAADTLVEPWFSSLRERLGDVRLFDAHTHLGCADPDGSCFDAEELAAALAVVDARAVVFPLAEPGSYRAANDRMMAAAEAADGRLVPFCRVDPRDAGVQEAQRAVALELARAHPRTPIILAHAAIADLAWMWPQAAGQRNLLFDTAWWNMADQLALFTLIPPGQILFASDTPYGRTVAAAALVLRAAMACGLDGRQIAGVAGGQLDRLLAGEEPEDLGPAPATGPPPPGALLERIHSLLVAAAARLTAGHAADEYLHLARLACTLSPSHPDAAVAASVRALIDRHAAYLATDPPRRGPRVPGIHLIFVAAAVARTPGLPQPEPEVTP